MIKRKHLMDFFKTKIVCNKFFDGLAILHFEHFRIA